MLLLNLFNVQQTILLLIPATNFDVSTSFPEPVLSTTDTYRPVVIWHGLGDNYNTSGIHKVHEILDSMYPGIFVYAIRLDDNPSSDEQKSFLGMPTSKLTRCANNFEISLNYCMGLILLGSLKVGFL